MKNYFVLFFIFSAMTLSSQMLKSVDAIAPFSEGLAAVRVGEEWGFINNEGRLVIDFRDDLVWNENPTTATSDAGSIAYPKFKNGRCMIKEVLQEEGITVYGFINMQGETVISPEYLNVTEFDQGYAIGILLTKTFRGKNNFQLNIYQYRFSEVVLDTSGDIMHLVTQRKNILMDKRRYDIPEIRAKYLSKEVLAVKTKDNTWELITINL